MVSCFEAGKVTPPVPVSLLSMSLCWMHSPMRNGCNQVFDKYSTIFGLDNESPISLDRSHFYLPQLSLDHPDKALYTICENIYDDSSRQETFSHTALFSEKF
jgi:hypothetical protein